MHRWKTMFHLPTVCGSDYSNDPFSQTENKKIKNDDRLHENYNVILHSVQREVFKINYTHTTSQTRDFSSKNVMNKTIYTKYQPE